MNEYTRFAVASLNQTERTTDQADKIGALIVALTWLDLAHETTQLVDREADEAHSIIERPLKTASCRGRQPVSD
jgi:hypothetical protein